MTIDEIKNDETIRKALNIKLLFSFTQQLTKSLKTAEDVDAAVKVPMDFCTLYGLSAQQASEVKLLDSDQRRLHEP